MRDLRAFAHVETVCSEPVSYIATIPTWRPPDIEASAM
jgi:hypothetical protein